MIGKPQLTPGAESVRLPGMETKHNKLTGAGDALRALDAALDAIGLNKRTPTTRKMPRWHADVEADCGHVECSNRLYLDIITEGTWDVESICLEDEPTHDWRQG